MTWFGRAGIEDFGAGVLVASPGEPMVPYRMSADHFEFVKMGSFVPNPKGSSDSNREQKRLFDSRLAAAIRRDEKQLGVKIYVVKRLLHSIDGRDKFGDDGFTGSEGQVATGSEVDETSGDEASDEAAKETDGSDQIGSSSDSDFEIGGVGQTPASTSKTKQVKTSKAIKVAQRKPVRIPRIPTVDETAAVHTPRRTRASAAASPATSPARKRQGSPLKSQTKKFDLQKVCRVEGCELLVHAESKNKYCRAHKNMFDRINNMNRKYYLGEESNKKGQVWTPALRNLFFEQWLAECEVEHPSEGQEMAREWVKNHAAGFDDYVKKHADAFLAENGSVEE